MTGATVQDFQVDISRRVLRESFEEIFHQFGLKITDFADLHTILVDQLRAAAQINGCNGQGLVHRQHEISRAIDSNLISESLCEGLSENDAAILDGMMLIDIEVSLRPKAKVERSVLCEKLQHVIEEVDAGEDFVLPFPFDDKMGGDLRLLCFAVD